MAKHDEFDTAYSAVNDLNPWRPGTRQAPVASAGALVLSLVGVLLSAIILAVSDGRTLESWDDAATFSPATYLSIASTITNITLHFALDGGITISWWRRALRPNTQVADLHRIWSYGDSFFAALSSFRNFHLVALASILVTLAPINGPLLQRASRVASTDVPVNRTLSVQIAAQLPKNYTGYMTGRTAVPALLTTQFADVVRSYYRRDNIPSNSSCQGTCRTHVLGAGWAVSCDSSTVPYNMSEARRWAPDFPSWTQVFDSNFRWEADLPVIVQVGASFKTQNACTGDLVQRNCTLVAATVKYPVEIGSGSIALDPSTTIWDDAVVGPVVNGSIGESAIDNDGKTTYGGLQWALSGRFQSSMLMLYNGPNGYEILSYGELASAYATNVTAQPACDVIFTDPMDDMLAGARELMFRAAVDAGLSNGQLTEFVTAVENARHNVYKSNYLYFGIATGLSVLSIVGVVGTFNGFWLLGRSVSLSPVETAKAFNPPILSNNDSNATIKGLLEEVGTRSIRYGCVVVAENTKGGSHHSQEHTVLRQPLPEHVTLPTEAVPRAGRTVRFESTPRSDNTRPAEDAAHEESTAQPVSCHGSDTELPAEITPQDEEQPLLRLQLANPELVERLKIDGRYTGYHY